jgi:hypothetical protein
MIRIRSLLLSPTMARHHQQPLHAIATTTTTSSTTTTTTIATASFSNKAKKTKSTTPNKVKTLSEYNQQKQSQKTKRTQRYNSKQHRLTNILPKRKATIRKNQQQQQKQSKRTTFHTWFDAKTQNELYYNRQSKRESKVWKLKVAIMMERLPVVMSEREDWELEYMYMKANYDRENSVVYPKELNGFVDPMDTEVLTVEEMYEQLPEGFELAPRITEEDKNNIIQSTNRKLSQRVYLSIRPNDTIGWSLPTIPLSSDNETTFVQCIQQYMKSNKMYQNLNVNYLSECPMGVDVIPYNDKDHDDVDTEHGKYFGEKVFYMRVQYEDGDVVKDSVDSNKMNNWGWLAREEMVDHVREEKGEDASLFYKYML